MGESEVRIAVLVSVHNEFGGINEPRRHLKVRKLELVDGAATGKWLLSFETGEWVQIAWGPMTKGGWTEMLALPLPSELTLPLSINFPGQPLEGEMPKRCSGPDCVFVDVAVSDGVLRVRRLELAGGRIVSKHGLSLDTGEWVPVAEGQAYPDECLLQWQEGA